MNPDTLLDPDLYSLLGPKSLGLLLENDAREKNAEEEKRPIASLFASSVPSGFSDLTQFQQPDGSLQPFKSGIVPSDIGLAPPPAGAAEPTGAGKSFQDAASAIAYALSQGGIGGTPDSGMQKAGQALWGQHMQQRATEQYGKVLSSVQGKVDAGDSQSAVADLDAILANPQNMDAAALTEVIKMRETVGAKVQKDAGLRRALAAFGDGEQDPAKLVLTLAEHVTPDVLKTIAPLLGSKDKYESHVSAELGGVIVMNKLTGRPMFFPMDTTRATKPLTRTIEQENQAAQLSKERFGQSYTLDALLAASKQGNTQAGEILAQVFLPKPANVGYGADRESLSSELFGRPFALLSQLEQAKVNATLRRIGQDADEAKAKAAQQNANDPKPSDVAGIRKEFTARSTDFLTIRDSYRRLETAARTPSAAGDMAMIFNFMKMLDPNSVVRESEYATAAAAAGVPERIWGMFGRVQKGETFSPATREDFLSQSRALMQTQVSSQASMEEEFRKLAGLGRMDPQQVVPDYVGSLRPRAAAPSGPQHNDPLGIRR